MHYGKQSFSKNGKPTILAVNNPGMSLGQRQHLSTEDVIQLNNLYKCKGKGRMNKRETSVIAMQLKKLDTNIFSLTVYILPYKNGERDDLKKLNALYTSYRRRSKRYPAQEQDDDTQLKSLLFIQSFW